MAGEVNAFIERNNIERDKPQDLIAAAASGAQTLRQLGRVLGLFRLKPQVGTAKSQNALLDQVMALMIRLRQDARGQKNFAMADSIRKGLTDLGITLEDGPEGTRWRKE